MNAQRFPHPLTPLTLVSPSPRPHTIADRPLVMHTVGARSTYLRLAPVMAALDRQGHFRQIVIDLCPADTRPADADLDEIGFPRPSVVIPPGEGGPGARTARLLAAMDDLIERVEPALLLAAGDGDATLACALSAAKRQVPVARLEAGLRSFDWASGEEINRVVADRLSDLLFVDSAGARDALISEGTSEGRINLAGNTTVDWLRANQAAARLRAVRRGLGLRHGQYVVVTLHRRATTDGAARAEHLGEALARLGARVPVVLLLQGRTAASLAPRSRPRPARGLHLIGPLSFLDYLSLTGDAGAIVTDSGSVQEEASALGVPCYTLRATTERLVTLTEGTNVLLGDDPGDLDVVTLARERHVQCTVPGWDGRAAERVADALVANFALQGSADVVS